jgi:hypothetical protein
MEVMVVEADLKLKFASGMSATEATAQSASRSAKYTTLVVRPTRQGHILSWHHTSVPLCRSTAAPLSTALPGRNPTRRGLCALAKG